MLLVSDGHVISVLRCVVLKLMEDYERTSLEITC